MRRLTYMAAAAATMILAACSKDSATEPTDASEDDYSLVLFGTAGAALEGTLGAQSNRAFDGRTGGVRLPDELKLTDEQRAEIEALRAAFEAANADALADLKDIFARARAAREAGATRAEVHAILEEGRAIGQTLRAAVQALHEAIQGVFTAEQLAWIAEHRPRPPRDLDGRTQRRDGPPLGGRGGR